MPMYRLHTKEEKLKISLALKGKKKSQEHIANMSKSLLGRKLSEEHKRKVSEALRGKTHSLESRKRMSEAAILDGRGKLNKGKTQSEQWKKNKVAGNFGENHWNWKGGITPDSTKARFSEEGKKWTKDCMGRDNYTCQKCLARNGLGKSIYLHVHHVLNFSDYPELRFVMSNGITFCRKCHKEFHSLYGIKNNTIEQLRTHLEQKQ